MSAAVADERRLPFFMVTKAAVKLLRSEFSGRRQPTARSVYFAFLELANDARSEQITKPRKAIAEAAGVNVRVVDEYAADLERVGLLRIERTRVGDVNLPNRWILVDPPATCVRATPSDPACTTPSDPACTTPSDPADTRGSDPADTPIQEEGGTTSLPEEEREEARGARLPAVTCQGQKVKPVFVERAVEALRVFNEVTGRRIGDWTAARKPSPELRQILGAVLARPEVRFAEWEAAIRSTAARPPEWLRGDPLQVGTIFGEKAAGRALALGAAGVDVPPTFGARPGSKGDRVADRLQRLDAELEAALAAEADGAPPDGEIVDSEVIE